jgi:hypothetical protein
MGIVITNGTLITNTKMTAGNIPPPPPTPSPDPVIPVPASVVLALDAGDPLSYPGSGNIWYDLSTSNNDATFGSGISYATTGTTNGGFLNLVGNNTSTGSFVNPQNIPTGNSAYSTVVWLKIASTTRFNSWLGWGTSVANQVNNFRFTNDRLLQNYFVSLQDFNTRFTQTANSWYFITFTWNGSTANLYVRGAATENNSLNRAALNITGTSNLNVGNDKNNNPISGSLAFLRIYNVALSSTEVTSLYNSTRARYGF